jgi:hypothetical protein
MRRWLKGILIVGALGLSLSACGEPGYGYYGNPGYGYAPYSYGWPYYAHGYEPVFADHHSWEDHHGQGGHHDNFYSGSPVGAHFGDGSARGFGGGGHSGGFGGGHGGGGGHR